MYSVVPYEHCQFDLKISEMWESTLSTWVENIENCNGELQKEKNWI